MSSTNSKIATDPRRQAAIHARVDEIIKALQSAPKEREMETMLKSAGPLAKELGKLVPQLADLLSTSLAVLELKIRHRDDPNLVNRIATSLAGLPRIARIFVPISNDGHIETGWHPLPFGFGVLQLPRADEELNLVPENFHRLLVESYSIEKEGPVDPFKSIVRRYPRGQRFISATASGIPLRMVCNSTVGEATDRLKFWVTFGAIFLHFRLHHNPFNEISAEPGASLVSVFDEAAQDVSFDGQLASLAEAHYFSKMTIAVEGFQERCAAFNNLIGHAFSSDGDIKADFEGIYSAALWLFDSRVESNETVAFLNACIGLEAILGDDNKDSITERLADRCAYLLARTSVTRAKMRDDVRGLYNLRSKIVHGRRRRLSSRGDLDSAKGLLQKVIQAEIFNYLKADRESRESTELIRK